MKSFYKHLGILFASLLILQSCAGSGSFSKNSTAGSKEYSISYGKMQEIVEQVAIMRNMNINYVNESDDKKVVTLIVSRDRYLGNRKVQQEQGEIRIIKISDNTTRVEVDNPEYHFTVPRHQKEDYQQLIFTGIDLKL